MDQRSVLLVDVNGASLRNARVTLEFEGFQVVEAHDGEVGLNAAQEHRPGLVVSAVGIPRRDGYELCRAIRNDPALAATRVLLTYSSMDLYDEGRARRSGAAAALAKPYQPSQLLEKIGEVMGEGFLDDRPRPIDSLDGESMSSELSSGDDALSSAESRFLTDSSEEARPLHSDFIASFDTLSEPPSGFFEDEIPSGNIEAIDSQSDSLDPDIADLRQATGRARAGDVGAGALPTRAEIMALVGDLVRVYLDEHLEALVAKKVDEAVRERKP